MTDSSSSETQSLLNQFFQQHLPITDYLNLRVENYDEKVLTLAMDLKPSLNDKLTAFGGSLYCLTVMSCWGMVYLQARQRNIDPNIVVRHGEIDYLNPVDDKIIYAQSHPLSEQEWDRFFDRVQSGKLARIKLSSSVTNQGKEAVLFHGEYALIGAKEG